MNSTSMGGTDVVRARLEVLDELKSLFRGEVSAVESYGKALTSSDLAGVADILRSCRTAHQERANLLSERIRMLGGEVPTSSGVWGALANTLQSAATAIGLKPAIAVLEEGEDHGLRDYRKSITSLDAQTQQFVTDRLLPGQIETHRVISDLKRSYA